MSIESRLNHQIAAITLIYANSQIEDKSSEESVKIEKITAIVNEVCKGWARSNNGNLYINCKLLYNVYLNIEVDAFRAIYRQPERLINRDLEALIYSSNEKRTRSNYITDIALTIPQLEVNLFQFRELNLRDTTHAEIAYDYHNKRDPSIPSDFGTIICDLLINNELFSNQTLPLSFFNDRLYITVFKFAPYETHLTSDGTFQLMGNTMNVENLANFFSFKNTPLCSELITLSETYHCQADL